ncbi:DUF4349 domain-containing protein [Sphingomonas psychrotolerans]|uniref:DUF4349 domain-containing protein n=1 Tax=Sphingomonas psychrotolerans TaxID=1327635 RepID=A0ABU3N163_9SPHN|nr:DUF4349 domain-containing protein [Sphingomonas psychrotolerans]MDT8757502.1 DUF4349 domain-containing protein [Sphingomonas psychrotolerans]
MRVIAPRTLALAAVTASLAACSPNEAGDGGRGGQTDAAAPEIATEAVAPATGPASQKAGPSESARSADTPPKLPVSLPKLTYAYALSYLLPGDKIAAAQDAHRDMCEEMGPARCQLLGLERGVGEEQSNNAKLRLRVATGEARRFQILLDHEVSEVGGRAENAKIATDEVSKQMVDTEARIRQRELLVARLTEMLRKRTGRTSDLLEAERSVTQAQEELDQARSWLGELRGRVAMSEFEIHYAAIAPSASSQSLGAYLGEAAQGSGAIFQTGLRSLLSLAIYLLPWFILLGLPVLALRALRKRRTAIEPA